MSIVSAAIMILFPAVAAAQTLTGGSFEMRQHGMGPVVQGELSVLGSSVAFSGGSRSLAAAYPLLNGNDTLTPTPGGILRYAMAQSNLIVSGGARVFLAGQSVPEDFDFFINSSPLTAPMRVSQSALVQANSRLSTTVGPQATLVPGSPVEFNLLQDSGSFYDGALGKLASVTLSYPDVDGDGLVDGTNIRVKTLGIYTLDEARSLWVRVPASIVDTSARTVTAMLPHFSVYSIIGAADQDVDRVHAFPVPWAPNSGNPAVDGDLQGGITFNNLPSEGTINIYTLAGQLVRSLNIVPFNPQLKWDVKTTDGKDVVSGVYLWRVKSGNNVKRGKLIIIR